MRAEHWIIAGSLYHLGLFVFHALFWRLFRWETDLRSLNRINRSVMPVMNWYLMAVFLAFAILSYGYSEEMLDTGLGRALTLAVALLWLFRAALQVPYFRLEVVVSRALFLAFLGGSALYAIPLWMTR